MAAIGLHFNGFLSFIITVTPEGLVFNDPVDSKFPTFTLSIDKTHAFIAYIELLVATDVSFGNSGLITTNLTKNTLVGVTIKELTSEDNDLAGKAIIISLPEGYDVIGYLPQNVGEFIRWATEAYTSTHMEVV